MKSVHIRDNSSLALQQLFMNYAVFTVHRNSSLVIDVKIFRHIPTCSGIIIGPKIQTNVFTDMLI